MPVTQAVRDSVRDRLLRLRGAGGLSRVAPVVTLTLLAAGAQLTLAIPTSGASVTYIGTLTATCVDTGPLAASSSQNLFPPAR